MKLYVQRKAKGEKAYAGRAPGVARPTRKELAVALGWYWLALLDEGLVEDQAELARRLGVSRARVSQGMAGCTAPTSTHQLDDAHRRLD